MELSKIKHKSITLSHQKSSLHTLIVICMAQVITAVFKKLACLKYWLTEIESLNNFLINRTAGCFFHVH